MTIQRKRRELQYKDCNFQLIEIEPHTNKSLETVRKDLLTSQQESEQFMNRLSAALEAQKEGFRYYPPEVDAEGKPLLFGCLLRGYASTWDRDTIEDEMGRTCFDDSIKALFEDHTKRFGAPYIKSMRNHEELAAVLHFMQANDHGLYVEFWCLNTEVGRDYYVEVITGAINQMSIGFIPLETHEYDDNGTMVRVITKVELLEVSGVLWPCNYATSLGKSTEPEELKTLEDPDTVDTSPESNEEDDNIVDIQAVCDQFCKDLGPALQIDCAHTDAEHKAVIEAASVLHQLAVKTCPAAQQAKQKTSGDDSETGTSVSSVADEKAVAVLAELKASNNAALDLLNRLGRKD